MRFLQILFILLITIHPVFGQGETPLYSFFSAGHTYGHPLTPQYGFHPPFKDYFDELNDNPNLEIGFLTGDVVPWKTADYWDSVEVDMAKLEMPLYIAAGNHDIGDEFVMRFQDYYYSFVHRDDLFIVLTPGLDAWNISGDQLDFLTQELEDRSSSVGNIFIFLHELIWWSPTNEYQSVQINYEPHYPGSTNFEEVIKPLLQSYSNPITLFAGDLGATSLVSPFMFDEFDNITLIGSGMGGGVNDNIIITNVYQDSIYHDLIALNGDDPNRLGEIYDYNINSSIPPVRLDSIEVFPNPASDYFTLKNASQADLQFSLFNTLGQAKLSQKIAAKTSREIDTRSLTSGEYFILLTNADGLKTEKLIIK